MLLDAIQKDSLPVIFKAVDARRKEIKHEIANIIVQQEEYAAEQERLAAMTPDEVASVAPDTRPTTTESETSKKGRGKRESKPKQSKEELEEEKRKAAEKQAEEDARKNLEVTKGKLGEEDVKLASETEVLKTITKIDLFDSDGAPCNLRQKGFEYANSILRPNGVYTLVQVQACEDEQTTQSPIELSLWGDKLLLELLWPLLWFITVGD